MTRCLLFFLMLILPFAGLAEGMTLEEMTRGHGSLVSTTEEAVTQEQIAAVLAACEKVTLENEKTLHLTVITSLDLLQELLPTYDQSGLVKEGTAAIIVSADSNRGKSQQYHKEDFTNLIAAGMMTQQICIAAQMQGLGFKVITDSIYESGYSLYKNDDPSPENLVHEATEWENWVRMFAIPKENYYYMDESGKPVVVMGGKNVPLKSKEYTYFEADGTPALKRKVQYVEGYMTPVSIVLLGHSLDEPKQNSMNEEKLVTFWDGSYDPYPKAYGGSASVRRD